MKCQVPIILNSRLEPVTCNGKLECTERLGWKMIICALCGAVYAHGPANPDQTSTIELHERNTVQS